jgi:BTB/POZ domain
MYNAPVIFLYQMETRKKKAKAAHNTGQRQRAKTSSADDSRSVQTGCLLTDLLHLFETGKMYDCTFRVSPASGSYKVCFICTLNSAKLTFSRTFQDFKCHKLILSVASDVFQVMLYGSFKEGQMSPDNPIPMLNIDPEVFECAMR